VDTANRLQDLRNFLGTIPPGPIPDTAELLFRLAPCWGSFIGSEDEAMTGEKLYGRMEQVTWEPPHLCFIIERHGETAVGSTYATLQGWTLDVETRSASCGRVGRRQVIPRQPNLNVHPLVEEIAQLILHRTKDPRLTWNTNGRVTVRIGKIQGLQADWTTAKQTLTGRRTRFRDRLTELLRLAGWQCIRPNVYAPPAEDSRAS
jgi:hypothetical protein